MSTVTQDVDDGDSRGMNKGLLQLFSESVTRAEGAKFSEEVETQVREVLKNVMEPGEIKSCIGLIEIGNRQALEAFIKDLPQDIQTKLLEAFDSMHPKTKQA